MEIEHIPTLAETFQNDFIFGDLPSPEEYAARQQKAATGIVHNYTVFPRHPRPGAPFKLLVTVGLGVRVDQVFAYYTTDGSWPKGQAGRAEVGQVISFKQVKLEWSEATWNYVEHWEGEVPPLPDQTLFRYQIEGFDRVNSKSYYARSLFDEEKPDGQIFSLWLDRRDSPEWIRDAVMYHIFLDRFYPGHDKKWLQPDSPTGLFGGTLRGITDQLPYLIELGVNCLWLSPIFPAPSYHRYDSTSLFEIDPHLGTKADLKELVKTAHANGMRVLMDFVPNHTSNAHAYFQEALADRNSDYYSWFNFTEWPDRYKGFFDLKEMPQFNLDYPAARQHMLDAVRYWQREFGIDGYRLDYALGPSFDFWTAYRQMMKQEFPESFSVGEVTEGSGTLALYENRLDGCLDFIFVLELRRLFASKGSPSSFVRFVEKHRQFFAAEDGFVLPTFLDSHDMARFLWMAGNDKRRLKLAAIWQLTWPQPPIIYYGTEVGLNARQSARRPGGGIDHEQARWPMPWSVEEGQDRELLAFYQKLIRLRCSHQVLRTGKWSLLAVDDSTGLLAYSLSSGEVNDSSSSPEKDSPAVVVLLNTRDEKLPVKLSLDNYKGSTFRSIFSEHEYSSEIELTLDGLSGEILLAQSAQ